MSTILGNPITLGGGRSKIPDYTYTGNAEWYNEEHTILKLKTSGVLTLSKDCYADVFVVGGGGGGNGTTTTMIVGNNYHSGGGGGGGYTNTRRVSFTKDTQYNAVIGAGGAGGSVNNYGGEGGETSLNDVSAGGGLSSNRYSGQRSGGGYGGSGGGSGYPNKTYSHGGGNGGSDGSNGGGYNVIGVGQGTTTRAFGEPDGELFAGGGGAGLVATTNWNNAYLSGKGGDGGGGNGAGHIKSTDPLTYPTAGQENTGGGGGGGGYNWSTVTGTSINIESGAAGGSGVILIRFA